MADPATTSELGAFVVKNFPWIVSCIAGGVGLFYAQKAMANRLVAHESKLDKYFEKFDKEIARLTASDKAHDNEIAQIRVEIATLQERTSVLDEIKGQINDIWRILMRSFGDAATKDKK